MVGRRLYIVGFTLLCVAAAVLLPAVPQPLAYHDFADQRALFGIANFFDVASNLAFLVAALCGLAVVLSPRTRFESDIERWPYGVFCLGLLLTAAGSAYYHLAPDNERLFWDRAAMTIGFMALIAAQIVDRLDIRAGLALLLPMLLVGLATVVYWRATERAGAGNVVPYAILQVYAMAALLLIAVLHPSRYTHGAAVYWVFAVYVLSKLMEALDHELLSIGHIVSGHTLKHLAAAAAGLLIVRMLMLRTLRRQELEASG